MSGRWVETAVVRASTAGISDPDNIQSTTYSIEWLRCDSNGSNCDTVVGTGSTYTLASGDVGRRLRLRVSFEDGAGNDEQVGSYPWPARNRPAILAYPACTESDLTALPGRKVILTTTMTVGHSDRPADDYYGVVLVGGAQYGSVTRTDFVLGGENYNLSRVTSVVGKGPGHGADRNLDLGLNDGDFRLATIFTESIRRNLQLHVCNRTFTLASARTSVATLATWDNADQPFLTGTTRIIRLSQPASTEARLSALALSSGTLSPTFDRDTTSYTANGASGSRITVTPTTVHSGATVEYLDAADAALTDADTSSADTFEVDLGTDDTVIKVKVTAEDGTTTRTYTVTVKGGQSGDTSLSALAVSPGTLDPAFDSGTTELQRERGQRRRARHRRGDGNPLPRRPSSTWMRRTPTLTDADTASTDTFEVDVVTGDNVIKVKVTAEDGATTETYTVTVRRLSADASLSALAVSPGTLNPVFASDTTGYMVGYAADVSRVTVTPTTAHAGATVEYLDAADATLTDADASSTDTFEVDLGTDDDTVIKVKVTAEDGATTETYTLTFRGPSDDASLSALALDPGTLSPAFAPDATSYSASVGTEAERTTVTPTTAHAGATVEYLDAADAMLTDADTSSVDTFEVDLVTGENVIKVKVTAEDGTTTRTYTMRVQRGNVLRLVNGRVPHEGRLEMFHAGQWGTICDDYWTDEDADVACRVLGYEESEGDSGRFLRAYFGAGTGPIHLDNMRCRGNETSLLDCPRHNNLAVGVHNCRHREDVGVRCSVGSPRVRGAPALGGPGSDGRWGPGEALEVRVTFSEAVQVSTDGGTPGIEVRLGLSAKRRAAYVGGGGTDELLFSYSLQSGDGTHAAVHVSGDSLELHGGRIRSKASGRDALLDHPGASRAGEAGTPPPLTASFESVPAAHEGPGHRFTFELHFSHEIPMSYRTVAGDLLSMRARIERARRLTRGSNLGWEVTVSPVSFDDIVITLPATSNCSSPTAVCTSTGQKMETGISALVLGVPAVSVADAEVEEEPGATLDFVVTASRAPTRLEAVRYRTVDGTARAGQDYEARSGLVVFRPGVRTRTVTVPVIDDSHDEGTETMRIELSAVVNGAITGIRIADGTATGTITNSDPVPRAWLARFGRTVAEQSVDAVRERLSADRAPGFRGRIAGEALPDGTGTDAAAAPPGTETADAQDAGTARAGNPLAIPAFTESERRAFLALLAPAAGGDGAGGSGAEAPGGSMAAKEAMPGTAFEIARETDGGLSLGLWGRVARSDLEGRQGEMTLDGEVTSAMLGTDWRRRDALFGLMLLRSRGEGGFSGQSGAGRDRGGPLRASCPGRAAARTASATTVGRGRDRAGRDEAGARRRGRSSRRRPELVDGGGGRGGRAGHLRGARRGGDPLAR